MKTKYFYLSCLFCVAGNGQILIFSGGFSSAILLFSTAIFFWALIKTITKITI